jgi:hypothetical protein
VNGRAVSCGDNADAISKLTMPKDIVPNNLSSDFQAADLLYTDDRFPDRRPVSRKSASYTLCLPKTTSRPFRTRMAISEDSHQSFVIRSLENLEPSFHPRKIVMYVSIETLEFGRKNELWACRGYISVDHRT